jgi:serralysin
MRNFEGPAAKSLRAFVQESASPIEIAAAAAPIQELEPNDSRETALSLDRAAFTSRWNGLPSLALGGTIAHLNDEDHYSVHLAKGEHLYLDISTWKDPDWADYGTFFSLYDAQGRGLGSVGVDSTLFVAPEAGTYSFSIHAPRSNFPDQDAPDGGAYGVQVAIGEPLDPIVSSVWSGTRWNELALTYSFPASSADYSDGYQGNDQPSRNFGMFNDSQQAAAERVLGSISGFTNLVFTEAAVAAEGVMRFGMNDKMTNAYYPGYDDTASGDTFYQYTLDFTRLGAGSHTHFVLLHEIGHALGLQHGHEAGPYYGPLPAEHDSLEFSLMTYRDYVDGPIGGYSPDDYPQTFMMYDIATLQFLYGADFTSNAGDNVYRWSPTTGQMSIDGVGQLMPDDNHVFMTVWDGGGADTYDLSDYAGGVTVDLRPGQWTITSSEQLAHLSDGHYARGNVANAFLHNGDWRSLIENAVGGAGDDVLTGNQSANRLSGAAGNDRLDGREGLDWLDGGPGDDRLDGGADTDIVSYASAAGAVWVSLALTGAQDTGGAGIDTLAGVENLLGSPFADTLTGDSAANWIDGGAGGDTMAGGGGDDVYRVDQADDRAVEFAGDSGLDTVISTVSFTLGARVENLQLEGAATHGIGNDLDNQLVGSAVANLLDGRAGADVMAGQAGDDVYLVDDPGDRVVESSAVHGFDTIRAGVSFALWDHVETLILDSGPAGAAAIDGTGNWHDNRLVGNAADNRLDGGAGADLMEGGMGNDIYVVDQSGDRVVETAETSGVGIDHVDTVLSAVNFTLGAHVENLVLSGSAAINGTGNGLTNRITGNDAANRLDGRGGADVMTGGGGDDLYYGDTSVDQVIEQAGGGIDTLVSSVSRTVGIANLENLILVGAALNGFGNELANAITGNTGDNELRGLGGNDRLDGGAGADTMRGGAGDDVYAVDQAGDLVVEAAGEGTDTVTSSINWILGVHIENLVLTGSVAINGTGNDLANQLTGTGLANLLDGRVGADTMAGGAGDDTYVVDNILDRAIEAAGAGNDLVNSSVSFTLGANLERLALTGAAAINAGGNSLANTLTGNAAANRLDGGAGADALAGGLGNDTYVVDQSGDSVTEAAGGGTDTVISAVNWILGANLENLALAGSAALYATGNDLANQLTGNGLANVLNGRLGGDNMAGALGDDTYIVDNAGDTVTEAANAGTDTVQSSVTFTLGANVENLTLTGVGVINGTGNALANSLVGNGNSNRLDGGAGADSMVGGLGHDTYAVDHALDNVTEAANAGSDTVQSVVTFTLGANVENLTLAGTSAINGTGNALVNSLTGNGNSNRLDGGAGADTMNGGLGHDTYVVDNAGDKAIEAANAGSDTVQSSVTFTLGANVENLVLTGAAAVNGTGNALANAITGNGAANVLRGGAGHDLLRGGAGADSFQFDTAPGTANIDHIADFAPGSDRVLLENAVFAGLAAGSLPASAFATGTAATNASHRVLYDAATGALRFDSDGAGGAAAVLFAILDTHPASLAASDFLVI